MHATGPTYLSLIFLRQVRLTAEEGRRKQVDMQTEKIQTRIHKIRKGTGIQIGRHGDKHRDKYRYIQYNTDIGLIIVRLTEKQTAERDIRNVRN